MKELEEYGASLEAEIVKDNLKDIISDLSSITAESIGEALPGLAIFFKASKAISNIKDYVLMEKVVAFLTELSEMPADQRKRLVDKINTDKIYGQKFGSFLLAAIDRHDFAKKSVYLARACKFYERGDITKGNLIRINTMIENLHLGDIKKWMENKNTNYPQDENNDAYNNFLANGVIMREYNFALLIKGKLDTDRVDVNKRVMKTKRTNLGIMLYHIVKDQEFDDYYRSLFENYQRSDRY